MTPLTAEEHKNHVKLCLAVMEKVRLIDMSRPHSETAIQWKEILDEMPRFKSGLKALIDDPDVDDTLRGMGYMLLGMTKGVLEPIMADMVERGMQ